MVLAVLSFNGLHRLWMIVEWLRRGAPPRAEEPTVWPAVTLQLPLFNERYVVQRLIERCGRLDYPRDKFHIQVLDDSTDDTTEVARVAVAELMARGVSAELIHRTDRTGFKAGALEAGLQRTSDSFLAVFDADFLPEPDFLRRMMPMFGDERVGMAQARWGHINASDSWLTAAQATLLDGHFVVEHTARNASGRFFNFNGTAGIWRRQAIVDAGGWQHDTLTEDLDLSYRSQLAGWKFVYCWDVVAPAELPPDMAAFKTQQHRWAKGSIQTGKKLLKRIWASDIPLATKLEAHLHLTANFSYPLVVLLSLLLPLAVAARLDGGAVELLMLDGVLFLAALLPFLLFYGLAVVGSGAPGVGRRLARMPVVLALGLGMAVSQSRAVAEGLFGEVGTFVRTPKWGAAATGGYRAATRGLVVVELALAVYLVGAFLWVASTGYYASLPFLALFAGGYSAVALGSLRSR